MAIKPVLQYRNPDSTLDLNSTQARIVDRAIFDGGSLSLSALSLQVTVAPFIATGFDGMISISDANETRSVPAPAVAGPNRVSYLILHLEYRTLTTPIANLQVIPESTWLTSVSKNFFVTFAKFSIPFGATSMTSPGVVVDYSVGDWADKLGKTGWRMPVATLAALPVVGNRDGDIRITLDDHTGHIWNATLGTWSPFGGAVDLQDVAARSAEHKNQWHRVTSGSGFINEILSSPDGSLTPGVATSGVDQRVAFPLIPISVVANTAILPGCHFMVNGHFIKTHARDLTFAAPPGVGERYDLVMLEVWRQIVALPSTVTYTNQVPISSPFSTLQTTLEQMLEQGGTLGLSYDFSEMEAISSTQFVVSAYQFRLISNVNVSVLSDSASVAATITNIDGNAFATPGNDQRLWQAAAAVSSFDSVSWAMPLAVVRRSSDETAGPPFIDTYRTSPPGPGGTRQRFIFDICPRAELGLGLFEVLDTLRYSASSASKNKKVQMPSGFLRGATDPIVIANGTLTFPPSSVTIQGHELYWDSAQVAVIPPAPTAGGDARTDLFVLEISKTIHSPPDTIGAGSPWLAARSRIGTREEQWVARFRAITLPLNVLQTTVEGAMTASLLYSAVSTEPVLWNRNGAAASGEDPLNVVYALPLCLVHRRNTTPYTLTALGQNGADRSLFPGLPNQPASFPHAGEVLDVRSRVVTSSDELQRTLDESFDKLIAGDLRTNMGVHPIVTNVTGTTLLQVDQIAPAPVVGLYTLPAPANRQTAVWSESDEAELVTWTFKDMTSNHVDATGRFTWTAATNTLSITCPPGYHLSLDPQLRTYPFGPQNLVAFSNDSAGSKPLATIPVYFTGVVIPAWEVIGDPTSPALLKQTEVVLTLDPGAPYLPAAASLDIGVWMVRKNHEAGRSSALNTYATNRGLFAVPDLVHRIEYSLTGIAPFKRAWVGPILNTIDVPVVGDQITITQAALFASGSISSEIASAVAFLKSYAVYDIGLSSVGWAPNLQTIDFTAVGVPGFENCTITFAPGSIPFGTTARVTLLCDGDLVDRWFEIAPSSKQVRGPYRIGFQQFTIPAPGAFSGISVGGFPDALAPYADAGLGSIIGAVPTGSTFSSAPPLSVNSDLSFYAAGSGNASWQIWFNSALRSAITNISPAQSVALQNATVNGADVNIGAHSSVYSVRYPVAGVAHDAVILGCVRTPLPVGAVARIFYEYTPYQGITQALESKINGSVEAIADELVFTRGPNRPWLDPRDLTMGLLRTSNQDPAVYYGIGADLGLLGSSGRVQDRRVAPIFGSDDAGYSTWFATTRQDRRFRPGDRPPVAISQRLPYPPKQPDGILASGYVPESFLGNSVLLDSPVVRPVPVSTAFNRDEVSPWLLEYSAPWDRMWRSQAGTKTLYFPLPVNQGEGLVGLTLEVESAGPSGIIAGFLAFRDRKTNVLSLSFTGSSFNVPVLGPAFIRSISEISFRDITVAGSSTKELVLLLVSGTSDLRIGAVFASVVSLSSVAGGGTTARRYPYDDVTTGIGRTLRKGMTIQVPGTWTTEFASYEANTIQSGRRDVAGVSPARGKAAVGTTVGLPVYGSGGGLIGYVPGSDFELGYLSGYSSSPAPAGRETAPYFNTKARVVVTGANAPDVAVGSALAYMVRNLSDAVHMGVSTGFSLTGSTGVAQVRTGAAVDAFYPVGRPVFRRT